MTEHADFLAAEEEHRWTKPLHELSVHLRERAWALKGKWAWYVLPHGAHIGMRVIPTGQHAFKKQVRIARLTMGKPDGFAAEVGVFMRELGLDQWQAADLQLDRNQDSDTWRGVWHAIEPGPLGLVRAKCARCGTETPHEPAYKEDLCPSCAQQLGAEDAAARNAHTGE